MKQLIFCVTNDLVYDRRMQRICHTLQNAGYSVTLIGRCYKNSPEVSKHSFQQIRMWHFFRRGKWFYVEYQTRLFIKLMTLKADTFCAIDLDTILPVTLVGWLRHKIRIYDAHEWFTEVPELVGRNFTKQIWEWIASYCIPKMHLTYTVGPELSRLLSEKYKRKFYSIRNVPYALTGPPQIIPSMEQKILFYQGALNAGRGLEEIIDCLPQLPEYKLILAGEGDLSQELRDRVTRMQLSKQVIFLGWIAPENLPLWTCKASIGLNLLVATSGSYYYSLANKAFDYIQAQLPALHMDFPEYRALFHDGPLGVLVKDLHKNSLIESIRILENPEYYHSCQKRTLAYQPSVTWEFEQEELLRIYRGI